MQSEQIDTFDRVCAPTVPAQRPGVPSASYVEGFLAGVIRRLADEKEAIESTLDAFEKARQAWKELRS